MIYCDPEGEQTLEPYTCTNPVIHNEILVTYNGETHNIGQWGRIFGIDEERLRARIRNGWSFDKAISTPVNKYTKKVPFYE